MAMPSSCALLLTLFTLAFAAPPVADEQALAEDTARAMAKLNIGQVVQADAESEEEVVSATAAGTPVVMMHGMGDFANNPMGMVPLRKLIAKEAGGVYVHSVELCSRPTQYANCTTDDQSNGFLMGMDDQVAQFARVVRADPQLAGGFNAVGFSQGNTVIRGYIHRFNDPPVKSFVSMHGVMMGVAGLPQCPTNVTGLGLICRTVDRIASLGVYTSFVQNRLAQANYFRDPEDLETYRRKEHFLPYINNEVKGHENATYTSNFESLEQLALVMAEDDTMVHPKESEHFGYFKDGSMKELVAMRDAPWYIENWFGLRSLDQAGKLQFHSTPGNHLRFKENFLVDMVHRYFVKATPVVV